MVFQPSKWSWPKVSVWNVGFIHLISSPECVVLLHSIKVSFIIFIFFVCFLKWNLLLEHYHCLALPCNLLPSIVSSYSWCTGVEVTTLGEWERYLPSLKIVRSFPQERNHFKIIDIFPYTYIYVYRHKFYRIWHKINNNNNNKTC